MSYLTSIRANSVKIAVSRLHEARRELAGNKPIVADLLISQALEWLDRGLDLGPNETVLEEVSVALKAQAPVQAAGEPL